MNNTKAKARESAMGEHTGLRNRGKNLINPVGDLTGSKHQPVSKSTTLARGTQQHHLEPQAYINLIDDSDTEAEEENYEPPKKVLKKSTPAPPRIAISKLCDLASQLEKLDGLRHKETKTGRTKFILENRVDNSESSGREVEEAQFPAPTKTSCKIKRPCCVVQGIRRSIE